MPEGVILLADDDAAIRTVLTRALSKAGYDVRSTGTAATLWSWISAGLGDLVITDVVMPDQSAFDILPQVRKLRPELPVIVMSAQNTFMTAIQASELGVYEYLPKPFDINELIAIVGSAQTEPRAPKPPNPSHEDLQLPLIGRSPAMQEIYRILARLMQVDLTVMISGESGTGKELAAKALHDYGKRRNGPFVAINMAAIPRELIESELFGHEKGAFTGAAQRNAGRFEQADGGTLFLDEIGDMPMEAQTRLLRVLQEGEFSRVGGQVAIKANVRIVAATHRNIEQLVRQGLFREDLFYRLNVVPLRLPPLRERLEDIPDLVRLFLSQARQEELGDKEMESDAIGRLKRHSWPGNVRELENLVRRLVVLCPHETIPLVEVDLELSKKAEQALESGNASSLDLSTFIDSYVQKLFADFGRSPPPSGVYQKILREIELPLIEAVLKETGGNQLRAADILGLNRNTLRKKMKELGIIANPGANGS